MARPDHNAATLTIEQSTYAVYVLKLFRMMLKTMEKIIKNLDYQGADITLALRHMEDARMRCGKAMEPFETGFIQTDNPSVGIETMVNASITALESEEHGKQYPLRAQE